MSMALRRAIIAKKKDPDKLSREDQLKYQPKIKYGPSRTKQSFKDSTDINKILAKAQKAGSLSHLQKHGAFYGDFAEAPADIFEARAQLDRGAEIFSELPSEIRKEFKNEPLEFFSFVNDPANKDRLEQLLPELAKPGSYFPDVSPRTPPGALLGDEGAVAPVQEGTESPTETNVDPAPTEGA